MGQEIIGGDSLRQLRSQNFIEADGAENLLERMRVRQRERGGKMKGDEGTEWRAGTCCF